jgi:hypothetical protein
VAAHYPAVPAVTVAAARGLTAAVVPAAVMAAVLADLVV